MTIDEARRHVGAQVVYTPRHGDLEDGVITSVNDVWVFVRYGAVGTSKATDPARLELLGAGATAKERSRWATS